MERDQLLGVDPVEDMEEDPVEDMEDTEGPLV